MVLLIVLLTVFYFGSLFLFGFYLDIRYRKIPNSFFKLVFGFSIVLNIFELLFFSNNFMIVIFGKVFFFLITFFPSLLLFSLKIIGGSDGKLIILIFITHPVKFLNINLVTSFFLLFSFFFILLFILNFILNKILKDTNSFIIFFSSNLRYSGSEKLYIKFFYKFLDYSKLGDCKEEKFLCKSVFLVYNINKKKIQVLVQFRPPLIILIILTYLLVNSIKLII